MASEAVLKYLTDTNRPYSCADVTVNLRGAFAKSAVQKALDALSESGKIKCKLYGKQKVYAAIQPDNVEEDGDIDDYDTQFKTLTQNLVEKTNVLKAAELNLKNLVSAPTNESALAQISEANKRIEANEKKLESLKCTTAVISTVEKKGIMDEHDKFLREYRKRKRTCSVMLEAVLEGYPKSKKHLIEELCIETDENVEFNLMSNA